MAALPGNHLGVFLRACLHLAVPLALAVAAAPQDADAGILKKIKKAANRTANSVSATANSAQDEVDKAAHRVGEEVLDKGVAIGRQVQSAAGTTTHELTQDGKLVGRVVIQGGKIIATETVEAGKVVSRETETGAKLIVKGGKIVGREIVVDGKVVGEEIIEGGKVVGHKATAGGQYVIKAGEIVFDGFTNQLCQSTVRAIRSGMKVDLPAVPGVPGLPKLQDLLVDMVARSAAKTQELRGGGKSGFLASAGKVIEQNADMVPDLKRIVKIADDKRQQLAELFQPGVFCGLDGPAIDRRLKALGMLPELAKKKLSLYDAVFFVGEANAAGGKHFFFQHTETIAAAAGIGAEFSLSIATDFRGHGGAYISFGPQVLVTNVTASYAGGNLYYPAIAASDLEGWGWSVGISAGPPTKILALGVSVAMDENFTRFQGFGTNAAIGVGAIPGDVAVANTRTWKAKP